MFTAKIRIYPNPNEYFLFFFQYIDKAHQCSFLPKAIIILFMPGIHESYLLGFHFFIVGKII